MSLLNTVVAYLCCITLYCRCLLHNFIANHIYIAYLCCRVAVFCSLGLGSIFGRLGVSLFDFWSFWGGLRGVLGGLLGILRALGPLLGDLGSVLAGLGRSWGALGGSWAALDRS